MDNLIVFVSIILWIAAVGVISLLLSFLTCLLISGGNDEKITDDKIWFISWLITVIIFGICIACFIF